MKKFFKKYSEGWRRWRALNNTMDRITTLVLVLCLLAGAYIIYDTMYALGYNTESLAYFFEGGKEDWDKLPDNAIGWLTIDDTNINYPVMQGKDNEEYLNKDAFGQYSLVGSIFLDWRNDKNWKDDYNLLYGHHMSAKKMFGSLDDFKDKEFFHKHLNGTLKTRKADYSLRIYAIMSTASEEKRVFGAGSDAYPQIAEFIKSNSLIYEKPTTNKILAMSTCQDANSTERLILFASMKVTKEPGTLYDKDNLVEPK